MECIVIKDAFEHNLKHLNLSIPLNAFTCVTGCSGCGKSSLVFDTIYAESQRGFLEGMSGNIYGQKLMNKPKVGSIENLRPALNIAQNYYNVNPRSTVGTVTEISYYLRSLFALLHSNTGHPLTESDFSANNPKVFCPHCSGLGVEKAVSIALLAPDPEKRLKDGAILYFKGGPESKECKILEELCNYYHIDIDKKFSELDERELHALLYSEEKIKCWISYKEGRRTKKHYIFLQGAIAAINERLVHSDGLASSVYSKYLEEIPCSICKGAKLKSDILQLRLAGLNYHETECLEFVVLRDWLKKHVSELGNQSNRDLVSQLVDAILLRLKLLIDLDTGYLSLCRSIPSLSGGERQRVRIATQLACPLKGLLYILDEPCRALHVRDVPNIISATKNLVNNGNTIIAIEHNKRYINASDNVIELGPVGGPGGGYLIRSKKHFGMALQEMVSFKEEVLAASKLVHLSNINFRNIVRQSIRFPLGGITCITGVSGAGKSSLAHVVERCVSTNTNYHCDSFEGGHAIKRVIAVNQSPIGKTPRSSVVSYLGIYDAIRNLFARTATAKRWKLDASSFSMNVKGGRCEMCQGTGLQKIELNYLPSSYLTCPECKGERFRGIVLSAKYKGLSITDVLETPISALEDIFADMDEIHSILLSMVELGLGYLKLGQMSMNLSGGEAQRIKLAKALGVSAKGRNLYILDEPTSGLNDVDIGRFQNILFSLQKNGDTILIIEHNLEFVARMSDWVIDFGIHGGKTGGRIVCQGHPKDVFENKRSSLYGFKSVG